MNSLNESRQSAALSENLQHFMRQHPLFSFFFMAYAFSWIILIPYILSQWNVLPNTPVFQIFFILNPFVGPTLSAFIMSRITEGKAGFLNIRKRLRLLKVGWNWYAFILLGIPVMMLLGIIILPGALASFRGLPSSFLITYIIYFIAIFFGGGPLGEEIGWRGFALPRMQTRYGALRATLLLGILWTFWHLPHFLTTAQRGGPGSSSSIFYINLPIFFLLVMSITVIMTWVYNHTKGSLFIAILLHASINTFGMVVSLFAAPIVTSTDLPIALGLGVLAIAILIFTRGKLGSQRR
jgi:membrane protease YdiL (CAAX protease family)